MERVNIGNQLKELRNKIGITQKVIAEFLNIKVNSYSQYENNIRQPDFNILKKLAGFYGVSVDYLFEMEKGSGVLDQQLMFFKYKNLYESISDELEILKNDLDNIKLTKKIQKDIELLDIYESELKEHLSTKQIKELFIIYTTS